MKNVNKIIKEYISGSSCKFLGDKYNVSAMTIHKLLVKNNVPRRSKWQHNSDNIIESKLTNFEKDVISGCLLGDGSVIRNKINSYFTLTSIHLEFANYLNNFLPFKSRIKTRKSRIIKLNGKEYKAKQSYDVVSVCDKYLTEIRNYWYPNEKKIIPNDLKLSPNIVKYWFYGDGSTSLFNQRYVQLSLCTNCFSNDECFFLRDLLFDAIGIKFSVYQSNTGPMLKIVKSQFVFDFFNYIGLCELKCFDYKWKIPQTKRINLE